MKKILITGAGSYIGSSFEAYVRRRPVEYQTCTLDVRVPEWRKFDFSGFDTVFHVAGIAHSDMRNPSDEQKKLYYAVNCELAEETAVRARESGVRQFIFMSSAIVYGDSAPVGERKIITRETAPQPSNDYGDSKWRAEKALLGLDSPEFHVVILRAPMIYGKGSRGNYPLLAGIARRTPVFPYVENQRSMLYIENLCEFVRLMIEQEERGIFWPQNREYTNTSEMVRMIGAVHGRNVRLFKGMGWILKASGRRNEQGSWSRALNKAFGSLVYASELSIYPYEYARVSLLESIRRTEETEGKDAEGENGNRGEWKEEASR